MKRITIEKMRGVLRTDSLRKLFDRLSATELGEELVRLDESERRDASSLLWFTRQLEHVMAETEQEEFAELRMANGELVPIDSSIPDGAETFTYFAFSAVGIAQFTSGYSNGEFPLVTLKGAKVTGNLEVMENGYAWSRRDIRNAQFTGFGLETELSVAARRAHDELLNRTGLFGREDLGLPGLINHPNITVTDAAVGASTFTTWATKTVDEILADVNTLINTVNSITFGIERVNRVLIPREQWLLIKVLRIGAGDGTLTVLKYLEETHDGVTFEPLNELAAANSNGNLTADALLAYTAGNKRKLSLIAPMPFTQHPVQQENNMFKVPCESSTGGIKLTAPLSVHRMDGV